jgi:hypothetical protein
MWRMRILPDALPAALSIPSLLEQLSACVGL